MEAWPMIVATTRFGSLSVEPEDVISFRDGLIGLPSLSRSVLLADSANAIVAWLQSLTVPGCAVAVVHPRRFVPGYQVRVAPSELSPLGLHSPSDASVLVVVGQSNGNMTLNLKAPLVLNLHAGLGRQVITENAYPLRYVIVPDRPRLRRSA
jgi:flagellar assembly factor FliW